jgi:hypothetical protein
MISINGVLTNSIDKSPIFNKTITIIFNNKNISTVKTDKNGFYSFLIETDNLETGKYKIISKFISNQEEWRSSSSKIIEIEISAVYELLAQLFMISIIVISTIIILIFRQKIFYILSKNRITSKRLEKTYKDFSKPYILQKMQFDINDFIVDTEQHKTDEIRNSFIEKYQQFLMVFKEKIDGFSTGITHLDVRRQMLKMGFSRIATNYITKCFEYAMYSPHSFEKSDISLFNKSMFSILRKMEDGI